VREILETIEGWAREELRVVVATLVGTERSAPREPGGAMAISERGDVAGSLTGGCVEPALFEEARTILAGGPPRLVTYGSKTKTRSRPVCRAVARFTCS